MSKPPGKDTRGGRRDSGKRADKDAATSPRGRKPKAGPQRPGWLPDPSLVRAMGSAPRADLRDPHAEREAARYEQPIASRQMILQFSIASLHACVGNHAVDCPS